jgi:hypothetical protein
MSTIDKYGRSFIIINIEYVKRSITVNAEIRNNKGDFIFRKPKIAPVTKIRIEKAENIESPT